jgi:hypothetical protein
LALICFFLSGVGAGSAHLLPNRFRPGGLDHLFDCSQVALLPDQGLCPRGLPQQIPGLEAAELGK